MRHARLVPILAALLLGACGSPQTAQLPSAPTTNAAPAPTRTSGAQSPVASPAPTTPASLGEPSATLDPPSPEATAQLILPPTPLPPTVAPTDAPAPPAAPPATSQPAPQPAALRKGSAPVRLVIGDIGMDRKIVSVGLDKSRVPIVPNHDVGWYNLSAMPGQGENIVLWGHVLRFRNTPNIPAPFARLKELKPGGRVVLYDKGGNRHAYVVTQQVWVTPDQVEYILPQGKERVTMVSCIGDKVVQNGEVEMTHRLITIAEPES